MAKISSSIVTKQHLVLAIQTCSNMTQLKQIATQVLVSGLWADSFVHARLVAFCATSVSGNLEYARLIFDHSHNPSPFAYNTVIRGYSNSATPIQSLHHFHSMLSNGIYADNYVFPFLLKACARAMSLIFGRALHSHILKCGFHNDMHIQTSLLHMYAALNCISASKKVFDEMPQRSTVTWNALISCHLKSGREAEGLALFGEMVVGYADVEVNDNTVVAALCSCARLGGLLWGRCLHGFVVRRWGVISPGVELGTSLVHMYAKCGDLDSGIQVFQATDMRDVSAWTAMIGGLAMHGHGREALSLFQNMVEEGLKPDSVTFTSVLHACSHSNLVEDGLKVFNIMKNDYKIDARMEHFGSIVDLLGRAGLVEEAEHYIRSMPIPANGVIWGSLLNACMINGQLEKGECVAKHILKLGLDDIDASVYVIMSNVYAKVGKWDEVKKVRERMLEREVKKASGLSLVEVNGSVHKFLVGDITHSQTSEIYDILHRITKEITIACLS